MTPHIKLSCALLVALVALSGCFSAAAPPPQSPIIPEAARENLVSGVAPDTTLGDPNAALRVVVFQDTNCGMCRKMWRDLVNGILKDDISDGRVAIRFMEFPLGLAPNSSAIAIAAKCAAEQGRYHEFIGVVYSSKGEHGERDLTDFSYRAGLDISKMNECMNSGRGRAAAQLDVDIAGLLGIGGTPTFFVNGEEVVNSWTEVGTWDAIANEHGR